MTKIFTGLQPTGSLHIGNYLGSVMQWHANVNSYPESMALLSIVDQHAITVKQDPTILKEKNIELAAVMLASGIDYKKHIIFAQSSNPDHAYIGWMLTCMTPVGWLERMTQFKEKKKKISNSKESVGAGLLMYPVLMAADILLYDADIVPVGIDQKQHVELTRDIAARFNSMYSETLNVPEFKASKEVAKVYDLQHPEKKMSKSDVSDAGRISLSDTPDQIRKKIMRAVTDSENRVAFDRENKPGVSNLLAIMSVMTETPIEKLATEYESQGYGKFKSAVSDVVINYLAPFQSEMKRFLDDKGQIEAILDEGGDRAYEMSHPKALEIASKMGMYVRK